MRQQALRQSANKFLRMDRRGKYQVRKHRFYVIHKMIDDLYAIQKVPPSWQALESDHIHSLVNHWKQRRINPVTIMRYMTIIRRFLPDMDCKLDHIDNKSLQLVRIYKRKRSRKTVDANIVMIKNEMGIKSRNTLWSYYFCLVKRKTKYAPEAQTKKRIDKISSIQKYYINIVFLYT